MSSNGLKLLKARRASLAVIPADRGHWSEIVSWHTGCRTLIAEYFKPHLKKFDELIKVQFKNSPRFISMSGDNSANSEAARRDRQAHDRVIAATHQNLVALLDGIIELSDQDEPASDQRTNQGGREQTIAKSTSIFIVHGHDNAMKLDVARMLSKLGLEPIILHEQPDSGQTIIEKFERHSDVDFAIILLSPDDMAFLAKSTAKTANSLLKMS